MEPMSSNGDLEVKQQLKVGNPGDSRTRSTGSKLSVIPSIFAIQRQNSSQNTSPQG